MNTQKAECNDSTEGSGLSGRIGAEAFSRLLRSPENATTEGWETCDGLLISNERSMKPNECVYQKPSN